MSREYMDEQDRAYVQATKRHFRQWMERNGWSPDDLANITKVPATTIRRWVSPLNDQFMPLGAAHHICRRLGIDIQAILLPQGSTTTARATRIFLQLPPKTRRHDGRTLASDGQGSRRGSGHRHQLGPQNNSRFIFKRGEVRQLYQCPLRQYRPHLGQKWISL